MTVIQQLKAKMKAWSRKSQTESLAKEAHRAFLELREHTEIHHANLSSSVNSLEKQIASSAHQQALRQQDFEDKRLGDLIELKARHAELARSYGALSRRLDQILLHISPKAPASIDTSVERPSGLEALKESVQSRLEALNPRATKEQLCPLLPLIEEAVLRCGGAPILEIYKGDETWLSLLNQAGLPVVSAHDISGFSAHVWANSARAALEDRQDVSLSVVSAQHIVANLPVEELLWLVREAMRVLAPGGILLIETPDPECLGAKFYDDMQVQRPLTTRNLQAVAETLGFEEIRIQSLGADTLVMLASKPFTGS